LYIQHPSSPFPLPPICNYFLRLLTKFIILKLHVFFLLLLFKCLILISIFLFTSVLTNNGLLCSIAFSSYSSLYSVLLCSILCPPNTFPPATSLYTLQNAQLFSHSANKPYFYNRKPSNRQLISCVHWWKLNSIL